MKKLCIVFFVLCTLLCGCSVKNTSKIEIERAKVYSYRYDEEKITLMRYVNHDVLYIVIQNYRDENPEIHTYFYDRDTNNIECKTVYQPGSDVSFPDIEICWCVDLVEVPRDIFEQYNRL